MTTRPNKPARWADDGVSIPGRVEPSEGKKDAGFDNGEAPSAGEHNYQLGHFADWIQYAGQQVEATLLTLGAPHDIGSDQTWSELVHGHTTGQPRRWVLFGFGGFVETSEDGRDWTARSFDAAYAGNIQEAIYADDLEEYAFVGSSEFQHSPDGIAWTQEALTGSTYRMLARGNGQYIAAGTGGLLKTSADGTVWNNETTGSVEDLRGAAWSPTLSRWVVVGENGTILTSPDGAAWTPQTPDAGYTGDFARVRWNPISSLFIAVGAFSPDLDIQTSPDGINWTRRETAGTNFEPGFRFQVVQGIPLMLAKDPDDANVGGIAYSPDGGINWKFVEHEWALASSANALGVSVDETYIGMVVNPNGAGVDDHVAFSPRLGRTS